MSFEVVVAGREFVIVRDRQARRADSAGTTVDMVLEEVLGAVFEKKGRQCRSHRRGQPTCNNRSGAFCAIHQHSSSRNLSHISGWKS